ncbi:acetamidase/formamidase family protein [Labrenzia sp. 011]|uniref:acetamidase/formamidase family protein n=1 Tax=Labrenzia sp. 011 TaxID=2171494 RepID=UPI000D51918F|nr:acetamidase/formamidase family protein [Labrenzia sp. 011]PVB60847.1 AraC family transcriptional regulator [Labrenzia sp. 011]
MNIRQFVSESYPLDTRGNAWRDILATLGLRSDSPEQDFDHFAAAVIRGQADGVLLGSLTATAQSLSPLARRGRMPLVMMPLDEAVEVAAEAGRFVIEPGEAVILPADKTWDAFLRQNTNFAVFSLSETVLHGQRFGLSPLASPFHVAATGLGKVFLQSLRAAASELDGLSDLEWQSVEQVIADLYLTVIVSLSSAAADAGVNASQAALFSRLTMAIERRVAEPDLSAGRIARQEGISERYLQKLFEQNGESFTHYLRERRLQHARMALVAPDELRIPISEVAYSCGFTDAANFNRLFKERFGLPPGAFRTNHLKSLMEMANAEQRGWPVKALTDRKVKKRSAVGGVQVGDTELAGTPDTDGTHHVLPANSKTVHWGYFSRSLRPVLEISSGDTIEVETLTQHSSDDPELFIKGDTAAEDVFFWNAEKKNVDRRGAGPIDASVYGRGAGEGFGVHVCTGPIYVNGAEPGDVLEVRIDDMVPRPSGNPDYKGRHFGSSVAAWWGYQYGELLQEPKPRENVFIYEIFPDGDGGGFARAHYAYRWTPQEDPFGVAHKTYDYPGVPVDPATIEKLSPVLSGIQIPLRPHFGVIAVAPREDGPVDSVPPAYFGGNIDNWRLGKGASVYLPVSVPGALLSIGDPHASQGDGEVAGTAIECSMTGRLTVILHKKGGRFSDLTYPLIETPEEWVLTGFSHPNYLAEFGVKGQGEVYAKSSLDLAMKDAFRKTRRFLMGTYGLGEDEAIMLMSAGVDFGVTQVVDGNWGVHAIIPKSIFLTEVEDQDLIVRA